jgi:hypothetical protein
LDVLQVKPLKELSFNSPNITATMTSRQFQIVVDVMSNLLLARLPKYVYPFDERRGFICSFSQFSVVVSVGEKYGHTVIFLSQRQKGKGIDCS